MVLKRLEENAKNKKYSFERLYRNLYNPEFYLLAYKNIATSQGSMTAGVDGETLSGMSEERITKLIERIRNHSYQPNPAKRTYIEKKNSNKKRPLGIPSTDDKLVQEVIRMILEAIYETNFSEQSHGFRPNKSCHTALMQVQKTFTGAKWIIEGDIKACFDSFDHHVLINILKKRIHDEYFISLMWKFLKAGYMEQWKFHTTYTGTPQGSGMSPILANIYLSELDDFMEEYKITFDVGGSKRKISKEYNKINHAHEKLRNKYNSIKSELSREKRKKMSKEIRTIQMEQINSQTYPIMDKDFKRLQYNRYCDDFVIGVIGSKSDAEKMKNDIKDFLGKKLHLNLSEEKTLVTHSSNNVRYLGYDFCICRDNNLKRNKKGHLRRAWNGTVKLTMPNDKWIGKLKEYNAFKIKKMKNGKEHWKTLHRTKLVNCSDIEIISKYNAEIRGLYNYYRMAQNVSNLDKFYNIMKYSMLKTFASKYKTKVSKVKKKYNKNGVFGVNYKTKKGEKRCEIYNNGFKRKNDFLPSYVDVLPQYKKYEKQNGLAMRLRLGLCELCNEKVDMIYMYHVRRLKDLNKNLLTDNMMLNKRRKSLALCPSCFEQVKKRQI